MMRRYVTFVFAMRASCGWVALVFPLASFVASSWLCASDKVPALPTNEQLRHYRAIGDPRLSPDGRHVLLRITDSAAEGGKSHLWLVDVEGDAPRQLTYSVEEDNRGEWQGDWMPDGQSILFIAKRREHAGLYQLPMNGGEAKALELKVDSDVDVSKSHDALGIRRVSAIAGMRRHAHAESTTDVPGGSSVDAQVDTAEKMTIDVVAFRVAPNGRSIAVIAGDPQTTAERKQKDAKADAVWVDHDPHGTRLYLLDLATKKLRRVPVPPDLRDVEWSVDGSRLLAISEAPNGAADLGPAKSIWIISDSDAVPTQIAELPATIESATWSADGRSLLYLAQSKRAAPPGYANLYEYVAASKTVRNLTDGFAGSMRSQKPITLQGGGVVQLVQVGFNTMVAKFGIALSEPEMLHLPFASVSAIATNTKRSGWVFLGSSGGQPTALYYSRELTSEPQVVTTPILTPEGVASLKPKKVSWKNDNFIIEGLLYLPPEVTKQRVPLVVQVHGGPLGAYLDEYAPFVDFLLGHGWAVLRTNPRGSSGYGAEFAAANKNDLGGGDCRDIMAGVDSVLKTEPIDGERMALIGYSYGGAIAGFLEGKSTRFKAIASGAPVIDQFSEYGTENSSWEDRWYFGKPWEYPADVWRQSPLAGVGKAKTPFLLLQGENDSVTPPGQAHEMYRALRQMGVPVDLVVYPRDGHGSMAMAINGQPTLEPWHGFDARRRIVAFIQKAFGVVSPE
jgi:dipeptidyl aminopeptidase/acylaminoacyl peptidase